MCKRKQSGGGSVDDDKEKDRVNWEIKMWANKLLKLLRDIAILHHHEMEYAKWDSIYFQMCFAQPLKFLSRNSGRFLRLWIEIHRLCVWRIYRAWHMWACSEKQFLAPSSESSIGSEKATHVRMSTMILRLRFVIDQRIFLIHTAKSIRAAMICACWFWTFGDERIKFRLFDILQILVTIAAANRVEIISFDVGIVVDLIVLVEPNGAGTCCRVARMREEIRWFRWDLTCCCCLCQWWILVDLARWRWRRLRGCYWRWRRRLIVFAEQVISH